MGEGVGGFKGKNDSWQSDHGLHPKPWAFMCVFRNEMIVGNPIMFKSVNYLLREDVFAPFLGDKK
jgi:hypothetical protein